jgi:hypothetical protein
MRTRSFAGRSKPLPTGRRSRLESGSGSRSPQASAEGAPTPRRRSASPTGSATLRSETTSSVLPHASSARTCRTSSSTARSWAPATARSSRRWSCRRTTGLSSCFRKVPRRPRRATCMRPSTRGGDERYDERRASLLAALEKVRRPRDLAGLPSNDLASSPVADELLRLGAFRADVTGAGPAVYGLFLHGEHARAAQKRISPRGRTWLTAPAWYR